MLAVHGNCFCRLEAPSSGNAAADGRLPYPPKVWQCGTALLWSYTVDILISPYLFHILVSSALNNRSFI